MCRLGNALKDKRRLDAALCNLEDALRISKKILGPDSFLAALVYKSMGCVTYDILVRDIMSNKNIQKSKDFKKKIQRSKDFDKRIQSALECYENTVRIITALHGGDHPEVIHTLGEIKSVKDLEHVRDQVSRQGGTHVIQI